MVVKKDRELSDIYCQVFITYKKFPSQKRANRLLNAASAAAEVVRTLELAQEKGHLQWGEEIFRLAMEFMKSPQDGLYFSIIAMTIMTTIGQKER
jgi:hypothetical protein